MTVLRNKLVNNKHIQVFWYGHALHDEWRIMTCLFFYACGVMLILYNAIILPYAVILLPLACCAFAFIKVRAATLRWMISFAALFMLGCLSMTAHLKSHMGALEEIETGFQNLSATVLQLEDRGTKGHRLILHHINIENHPVLSPSVKVRLLVRTQINHDIKAGDRISLSAILEKPSGVLVPNGYDFGRKAFFEGLSATGYTVSSVTLLNKGKTSKFEYFINDLRETIANRLKTHMQGDAGALASALFVGVRGGLSATAETALRDAGLAHVLAISGLHMGLVTGIAFLVLEYMFAAIPAVGLRILPKKIAAITAFFFASTYLVLSGMGIATIRAYIMVSIALLAIVLDRKLMSIRSVTIAAFILLILSPESVLSVSFQMSFAAATGLIVIYNMIEKIRNKRQDQEAEIERLLIGKTDAPTVKYNRFVAFFAGSLLTTFISQIAIAPIAIYHFGTLSVFGSLSNIFVMPIVSMIVMPLGILALVIMPFGLDVVLYPVLSWSLKQIIEIALYFQSVPFAAISFGSLPDSSFFLVMIITIVLMLYRSKITFALAIFASFLTLQTIGDYKPYDLIISKSGQSYAFLHNGVFNLAGGRSQSFKTESWQRYFGAYGTQQQIKKRMACDKIGCVSEPIGLYKINLIKSATDIKRDCTPNSLVIIPNYLRRYCKNAALLITAEELNTKGPLAVRFPIEDSKTERSVTDSSSKLHYQLVNERILQTPWHTFYNGGTGNNRQ